MCLLRFLLLRLDLESFLIKPMQRLTRYPLFFQQLIKHTPETHPDYVNLHKCLDGLHKVVSIIDNQKQRNDNINKLLLLHRQFIETKEYPVCSGPSTPCGRSD